MEKQVYYQDTIARFLWECLNKGMSIQELRRLLSLSGNDEELKDGLLKFYREVTK
jgi:DNA-binding transcriptional MerR regulator